MDPIRHEFPPGATGPSKDTDKGDWKRLNERGWDACPTLLEDERVEETPCIREHSKISPPSPNTSRRGDGGVGGSGRSGTYNDHQGGDT